ncbi:MAG: rane bound O-acyl transferase family protein [Mycobacterium sp.]|nr:rane bound O-acyl transferase family protein [Mycobacterium sp.]
MVFPTIEFAAFFVVVLTVSWLLMPHPRLWKPFIIAASYFFYGYADLRFTLLLAGVTIVNQAAAMAIGRWHDKRILIAAIAADLGLLGWFKYYGFFSLAVDHALRHVHFGMPLPLLQVALPVGISFYTFQAISYVTDVWRGTIEPVKPIDFAVYQSFFPHLVAGPIVRASEFVPQLATPRDPRKVDATRAFFLIGGGLIKKVVIADLLATRLVDPVFNSPGQHSATETLVAIYGYAVQIYCDFSAYTEMAIGLALLLGFTFPDNFNRPYTATSLQDFWRRWHMTLSRWLRDYLYISLGGNRKGVRKTYRNLALTMILGGLWHGAAWTFVLWGSIHGGGLALERWWGDRRKAREAITLPPGPADGELGGTGSAVLTATRVTPAPAAHRLPTFVRGLITFHVVVLAWVFFRASDVGSAFQVFGRLFSGGGPSPLVTPTVLLAIFAGIAVQFVPQGFWPSVQVRFATMSLFTQAALLAGLIIVCNAIVGEQGVAPFIYFRF